MQALTLRRAHAPDKRNRGHRLACVAVLAFAMVNEEVPDTEPLKEVPDTVIHPFVRRVQYFMDNCAGTNKSQYMFAVCLRCRLRHSQRPLAFLLVLRRLDCSRYLILLHRGHINEAAQARMFIKNIDNTRNRHTASNAAAAAATTTTTIYY
jgi:hypothetical protein